MPAKTIILIDDDIVMNYIHRSVIESSGSFHIMEFTNPCEGLSKVREFQDFHKQQPCILFLDINMPYMDGWEFLDHFHKLPDPVQTMFHIVILTSSIDHRDINKSRNYKSVKGFISKPLTIEKFVDTIGRAGGRPRFI